MLDAKDARELTRHFARLERRGNAKMADAAYPPPDAFLSQFADASDYFRGFVEWMLATEIFRAAWMGRTCYRFCLNTHFLLEMLSHFECTSGVWRISDLLLLHYKTLRETVKWAIRLLNELGYSVIDKNSNSFSLAHTKNEDYLLGDDFVIVDWGICAPAASARPDAGKSAMGENGNA